MKRSAKAQYACLAMLELARRAPDQPPARIREIAEMHHIPERYLVQILLRLKGSGLVQSVRGASGGYHLARRADRISLLEVLTAIDGPDAPIPEPAAPLARALTRVRRSARDAERRILAETSLEQDVAGLAARDWLI
jgi:Rrf2 family protein